MRWAGLIAVALLLGVSAEAAVSIRHDANVTPSNAIPVTLAAGTSGTTLLGASATSASTSGIVPGAVSLEALKVMPGAAGWRVQVRVTGTTGISGLESAIVAVVGGTTQTLTILPGTSFPVTSGAVTLPIGGSPLSITIATVIACVGCTLVLEFRIMPPSDSAPLLVYPYTLATA